MELRDYQIQLSKQGADILRKYNFLYLSMEVRTGKTLTALEICKLVGAKKVLFITKIKAFSSIQGDFDNFGYTFDLTIINKESIHKIESNDFDIIVCDEAHGLFGAFPKPSKFAKTYKKRFSNIPAILMSGTIAPESWSQLFHQFWINKYAPFANYVNFYKWAKDFVKVKKKFVAYGNEVNDYTDADLQKIKPKIQHTILTKTQKDVGFKNEINEMFLKVAMKPSTYSLADKLQKDLIVEGKQGVLLADTAVKLQSKLHQIYSGTVKLECGKKVTIDHSKGEFIKYCFKGKKIAIFYKYQQELEILKDVFKNDLTTDLEEFNATDKNIAGQIQSIREGVNLSKADAIVFMNLDFSNVSYKQARDRMTTINRRTSDVYFIFAEGGIEEKIYKAVAIGKRKYDLKQFKKDYGK